MRIDLLFPALPPALDGIGDYTARLAGALRPAGPVRIWTAQPDARPISGVEIRHAFDAGRRSDLLGLTPALAADPPDWLILQFNQFSYGRWGLNPYLPLMLYRLRRQAPQMRIAWMAHEDFVPVTSWKNAVMTTWQRGQFWALGQLADLVLLSIETWAERYQRWFPGKEVVHLPVGSNMPHVPVDRAARRRELGWRDEDVVLGVFGTMHASRLPGLIGAAASRVHEVMGPRTALLYVGPDGDRLSVHLPPELRFVDVGRQPEQIVSEYLQLMDLHLAPFVDGVSTRRGSVMAGLQHGVPTLSTRGPLTGRLWAEAPEAIRLTEIDHSAFAGAAEMLVRDRGGLRALGAAGGRLYAERFSWPVLTDSLLERLAETAEAV